MGTSMKVNRPETGSGGGFALTYSELETVISVPAQSTLYAPIDAGVHRYEIKTVRVESETTRELGIQIMDRPTGGDMCYESEVLSIEDRIYDIAGVPITDKSGQKKIHAFIQNKSGATANIRVVIKIIPFEGGN